MRADGAQPRLRFRSSVVFTEDAVVRPDENGFRLLVEDANGKTVVDIDVPPTSPGKGAQAQGGPSGWVVRKGGAELRYRAAGPVGGIVPELELRKRGKGSNEWELRVKGRRGVLGDDDSDDKQGKPACRRKNEGQTITCRQKRG